MESERKNAREDEGQQSHPSYAERSPNPIYAFVILRARAVGRDGKHPEEEEHRREPTLDVENHAPKLPRLTEEAACGHKYCTSGDGSQTERTRTAARGGRSEVWKLALD